MQLPLKMKKLYRIAENIGEGISVMTSILQSVSDLMRTQTAVISPHIYSVEIASMLKKCIAHWKLLSKALQDIHFIADETLSQLLNIQANEEYLTIIIEQLLQNASQYSSKDSTITVEVSHIGEVALVTIRDEGIGISKEKLDGLFEFFQRADQHREMGEVRGLGIGLGIVKMYCDAMQCDIHVESLGENQGTTFSLQFPIAN